MNRSWGKSLGWRKKARKHRSDSKLNSSEMLADVSVKEPNKRLAGCWIKAKAMFAAMKMKQEQQRNETSDKSTYTTSNFVFRETMWAKTSKAWTWDHCSQTLNMRVQLLEEYFWQHWRQNIGLNKPFPASMSSRQYILFKVRFMLSMSVKLFVWFSLRKWNPVGLKFSHRWFQIAARVMFYFRSVISLAKPW